MENTAKQRQLSARDPISCWTDLKFPQHFKFIYYRNRGPYIEQNVSRGLLAPKAKTDYQTNHDTRLRVTEKLRTLFLRFLKLVIKTTTYDKVVIIY